jgi:Fur family ferric uptake transcriptional regulator
MKHQDRFRNVLEGKKLRKTAQRDLVWSTLLEADDHPAVDDVRERLLEKGHRIGLSTIYRTLKILLDSGMIRQSRLDGVTRYEPIISQPNHIHFVCNQCGKTEEYSSKKVEKLIRSEIEKHQFQQVYSRYAIFGFCGECAEEEVRETGLDERQRQQKILARDALELTLAVERRGFSFYSSAARKTLDPEGRKMFRGLADEESEHMKRLQAEYRALLAEHGWLRREPTRLAVSRKIADDIFPERALLNVEVQEGTTQLDALRIAIDLERKSHRFFNNFARKLDDPRSRKIFREFAREEQSHLDSLLIEYDRLEAKTPRSRSQARRGSQAGPT